jgi:capsular polysaccharide biosynthesis protein
MESKNFDFAWLVALIRRNIRLFIVVGVLAAIVGVVISLPVFMTPKFKSTAVVYPVNVITYSDESETEQLLQFFEASSIRDQVVEAFDLYERYEIDPEESGARFYLIEEYRDHVRVSKTQYESVRLEVIDEDPEIAKAMADMILQGVNEKFDETINERHQRRAESYELQLEFQRTVLDSLERMISGLSTENQILDYSSQTRELVRGYVEALKLDENNRSRKAIEEMLAQTQSKGNLVRMLQELSDKGAEQYDYMARLYLNHREMAQSDLNYIDVIVEPEVADKKFWPVCWLILVISVVVGVLVTLILLILFRR